MMEGEMWAFAGFALGLISGVMVSTIFVVHEYREARKMFQEAEQLFSKACDDYAEARQVLRNRQAEMGKPIEWGKITKQRTPLSYIDDVNG